MAEQNPCITRTLEANPLREPVFRSVIGALQLPPRSHGLDVGCGIGLQALLLADSVGGQGHITGVDIDPEVVAYGEHLVREAGLEGRITLRQGDMRRLPFADHTFDWIWSADCVGYPSSDLGPLLKELMRVVKPGGSIHLIAWSSQALLPGYPLLEGRLNGMCSSYFPFLKDQDPERHFLRALRCFQEAGLEEIKAQTFVGDVRSPLGQAERVALTSLFQMLWSEPAPGIEAEDWREYKRLCDPASPDFILEVPGYYAFWTCSSFRGRTP